MAAGRRGAHYITGDLPGWGLEDRLADAKTTADAGIEREPDGDADPNTLHVDWEQTPLVIPGLDTSDDSATDEEYRPEADDDGSESDWTPETITAAKTRRCSQIAPAETTATPTEKEAAPSRTIVPPEWGYTGARRPNALLIEGRPLQGSHPPTENMHVHFADVTFTSEESINQAIENKFEQYFEFSPN
jgi:hypothetical protein